MTQLLVSVRSADEAAEALRGGAHWIDLKDPARGALGTVRPEVAREVVSTVAGRAPVSAACGELSEWTSAAEAPSCVVPGVAFAKFGLAGCAMMEWQPQWRGLRSQLRAVHCELVAVAYVDAASASPPWEQVFRIAAEFGGFMLFDTYDKSAGSLMSHWRTHEIRSLLHSVRAAGLKSVVAGRLSVDDLTRLPLELIDMVGVRGAACRGGRDGTVCASRVCELVHALASHHAKPIEVGVFPRREEFA